MTCRELIDFLMAYVDGELSPDVRSEFERHLAVCRPCVEYLASYRQTVALHKQAYEPESDAEVCADVPEDLVKAILASRKR